MTRNAHEEAHVLEVALHSLKRGSFGKRPVVKGLGALGTGWKYGDSV